MFFINIDNGEIINLDQQQLNLIFSKLPVLLTDDHQYNKLVYYNLFGYNFPEDVDLIDNFLTSSICNTIIHSFKIKLFVDAVNMRSCVTNNFDPVSCERVFSWRDVKFWRDLNSGYYSTMYDVLYYYCCNYINNSNIVGLVSSK